MTSPPGAPRGPAQPLFFHQDVSNQFVFRFMKFCTTLVCPRPVSLNEKVLLTVDIIYFDRTILWKDSMFGPIAFVTKMILKTFLLWCVKHLDISIFLVCLRHIFLSFFIWDWFLFVFRFVKWTEMFHYVNVPSGFFFEFKDFTVDVSELLFKMFLIRTD